MTFVLQRAYGNIPGSPQQTKTSTVQMRKLRPRAEIDLAESHCEPEILIRHRAKEVPKIEKDLREHPGHHLLGESPPHLDRCPGSSMHLIIFRNGQVSIFLGSSFH